MNIEQAILIATRAHIWKKDKGGMPYIMHPLKIMSGFEELPFQIVAVLHDVFEDTDLEISMIADLCELTDECIEAIELLTHKETDTYEQYIRRIKDSGNKIAIEVKHADLAHNSDIRRLNRVPTEDDFKRQEKYIRAGEYLRERTPYMYPQVEPVVFPEYVGFKDSRGELASCLELVSTYNNGTAKYARPHSTGAWSVYAINRDGEIIVFEPEKGTPAHHLHNSQLFKCSKEIFDIDNGFNLKRDE